MCTRVSQYGWVFSVSGRLLLASGHLVAEESQFELSVELFRKPDRAVALRRKTGRFTPLAHHGLFLRSGFMMC